MAAELCIEPDCILPAHAGGTRCAAHQKRVERGQSTTAPIRERLPLRERVLKLVNDLADVDSEDDEAYESAWDALRKALEAWSRESLARRAALARWKKTSPEERSELARRLNEARWSRIRTGTDRPKRHRVPRAGKRREQRA